MQVSKHEIENGKCQRFFHFYTSIFSSKKFHSFQYENQRQIESEKKIIVGVHKFKVTEENTIPGFKIDDSIRTTQSNKLKLLREKRDTLKVNDCLKKIYNAASNNTNLMPLVVEAVENYCTRGEISDELRKVFGEFKA